MTPTERIFAIRSRCVGDRIMRQLMVRLAGRTASPTCTKEKAIRSYAVAAGIETSRRSVRSVVLFLCSVGVGEFEQNPEEPSVRWSTNAIHLAERVLGTRNLGWAPTDDEINSFMASIA